MKVGDSYREIRFFYPFSPSPSLHFYLMQFIGFGYFLYRFTSRNYTVYGFLSEEAFNYPRKFIMELWPRPLSHFTSFQFIYDFIPRPSPEIIFLIQCVIIGCCFLGFLGIRPKISAFIAFLLGLHLTGMMQASNSEIDGGTLALCLMLILALSPAECFYRVANGFHLKKRSVNANWPVFMLFLIVGAFYTYSGINKLVDIGPHWPFVLHLERLAEQNIERSVFLASRFSDPYLCSLHASYPLSVVAGWITLIGELGFITILFLPRYRFFFVMSMIALHVLVFLLAGINFVGSSFILLLCVDWNALVRKIEVAWDDQNHFAKLLVTAIKKWDFFDRIRFRQLSSTEATHQHSNLLNDDLSMTAVDENGESYYEAEVVEQAALRCPLLWPLALVLKFQACSF